MNIINIQQCEKYKSAALKLGLFKKKLHTSETSLILIAQRQ